MDHTRIADPHADTEESLASAMPNSASFAGRSSDCLMPLSERLQGRDDRPDTLHSRLQAVDFSFRLVAAFLDRPVGGQLSTQIGNCCRRTQPCKADIEGGHAEVATILLRKAQQLEVAICLVDPGQSTASAS